MNLYFSPAIRQKLVERHGVEELEVEEVFYLYAEGCYLVDNRETHRTVPPTLWFIGETVEGRVLKVVFIYDQESDSQGAIRRIRSVLAQGRIHLRPGERHRHHQDRLRAGRRGDRTV